jgi:restriction system protein
MNRAGDEERLSAEQRARVLIDRQLIDAGWALEDKKYLNLFDWQGVAVPEVVMAPRPGRVDYLLYVDQRAVGVIEAKPMGTALSGVEWQSAMYAEGLPSDVRFQGDHHRGPVVVRVRDERLGDAFHKRIRSRSAGAPALPLPAGRRVLGTAYRERGRSRPSRGVRAGMTIPDFQSCMRPTLALLADGETWRVREVYLHIADHFKLTPEEREQLLPSGRQRTIDNRVGWALTYLVQAGLAERPQRAHARITNIGIQALADHPDRIDMKVLERFPAYVEFRDRTREHHRTDTSVSPAAEPTATPQDLLDEAVQENTALIESQLLAKALSLPSIGFEDLVMKLLGAMGYGNSGRVERTSATGDAGIDGIISQDPLGLDRIYVQAKRYETDKPIHRPTIQSFVGALMGAQGDRGVFITTSSFSAGARDEAEKVAFRIELIDGPGLAQLMLRYRVGVQPETTVSLFEIDEDFFEEL